MPYPLTVGHEIAGSVAEVGAEVTKHAVGDRVGVGCMVNSCRECANCRAGQEQYCLAGNTPTYATVDRDGTITQGGYSTHVVVDEDFVLRIPDAIPYEAAAPLLCAGITTYSPLTPLERRDREEGRRRRPRRPGPHGRQDRRTRMGAEVTVLSQSLKQAGRRPRLGAEHYYATSDPATFEDAHEQLRPDRQHVSAPIDINAYLRLLRLDGTLVNVGAPPSRCRSTCSRCSATAARSPARRSAASARPRRCSTSAPSTASRAEIELIAADEINEAYERVLASDVRYRFVIDIDTLR